MRSILGVLAAVLLALGIPVAASSAPTGVGIALLDGGGQHYITETVAPGAEITRQVRVSNNTGIARDVAVTVVPATNEGGGFVEAPAGKTNPLTAWTTVDQPVVHLATGQTTDVTVTLRVPETAPDTVQHALVFASVDGAKAGIRMYVTVAGNGPAAAPVIDTPTADRRADGTAVVRATVTNPAAYPMHIGGELDLTNGPGGAEIRGIPAGSVTVEPGQSTGIEFVVPGGRVVADGPWTASVTVADEYARGSRSAEITFPAVPVDGGGSGSLGSLDAGSLGGLLG